MINILFISNKLIENNFEENDYFSSNFDVAISIIFHKLKKIKEYNIVNILSCGKKMLNKVNTKFHSKNNFGKDNWDIIIYADYSGFKNYCNYHKFLSKISPIIIISMTNVVCNDFVFFFCNKHHQRNNSRFIRPPYNNSLYFPSKLSDGITILLDLDYKGNSGHLKKENINQNNFIIESIKELKNDNPSVNINLIKIFENEIHNFDFNKNMYNSQKINNYLELISIYRKCDIFFINKNCTDKYKVYELIFCKVIIAVDEKYLSCIDTTKNFNYYFYNNEDGIDYSSIMNKINKIHNNIKMTNDDAHYEDDKILSNIFEKDFNFLCEKIGSTVENNKINLNFINKIKKNKIKSDKEITINNEKANREKDKCDKLKNYVVLQSNLNQIVKFE